MANDCVYDVTENMYRSLKLTWSESDSMSQGNVLLIPTTTAYHLILTKQI